MCTSSSRASESILSKRRLGTAAIVASISCALACALPLVAATMVASGVTLALPSSFDHGNDVVVGAVAFVATLGVLAIRGRLRRPGSQRPRARE